jgi:DNA-binding response OmpR family regulator
MEEVLPHSTILAVDDELPILEVIRSALTRQGHTVTTAFSGEEAVAIIDSAPVDLIISDINMSGGGGIELLQAIRTRDVDLPVILMTGAPDVESAIRCVELGAHRYLRKPFGLTELKNAVAAGLRNGRQARDARLVLAEHEAEVAVAQVINAELDRALASASMAYQPIVDRPRRELLCYEALLRTREPTFPHPGAVFAAAERLGRVADVGRWVRNRVASEMSGNPSGCVFVNVHPAELQDEHLYDPEAPLRASSSAPASRAPRARCASATPTSPSRRSCATWKTGPAAPASASACTTSTTTGRAACSAAAPPCCW